MVTGAPSRRDTSTLIILAMRLVLRTAGEEGIDLPQQTITRPGGGDHSPSDGRPSFFSGNRLCPVCPPDSVPHLLPGPDHHPSPEEALLQAARQALNSRKSTDGAPGWNG
ncbi:MAG TPA: hypothetical protein VLH40_02800 [Atribacteraceae bacterium]|nr:hypothetical protein [Atribacteraceae bacterium]